MRVALVLGLIWIGGVQAAEWPDQRASLYEQSRSDGRYYPAGPLVRLRDERGPTAFRFRGRRLPIDFVRSYGDRIEYHLKTDHYMRTWIVRERIGRLGPGEWRWTFVDIYDFLVRVYVGNPDPIRADAS